MGCVTISAQRIGAPTIGASRILGPTIGATRGFGITASASIVCAIDLDDRVYLCDKFGNYLITSDGKRLVVETTNT